LKARFQNFTDALLTSDPPIEGLDETMIVKPIQLHITLGTMCLNESEDDDVSNPENQEPEVKTVQQALDLLNSLRAEVMDFLRSSDRSEGGTSNTRKLRVNLDTMGTLNTGENETAHVLWIGPEPSHSSEKTDFERVAGALK
jgi:activating signal cointegrator complex subunit 1